MAVKENNSFKQMQMKNLSQVFHTILNNHPISRVEIAQRSGLTKMTVTNCTKSLIEKDLILECQEERQPVGRPQIKLDLNRRIGLFVGVEVNVISCKLAVMDISGRILTQSVRTDMTAAPEEFIRKLKEYVDSYRPQSPEEAGEIIGVGVALPGNYNQEEDRVEFISTLRSWNGFPLKRELSGAMPELLIDVQNAARAGAKGEIFFGGGSDGEELIYIHGAMGLSLSMYSNDGIHIGHRGYMSRFGHMIVDVGGRECVCGNRGCLEAYASMGALAHRLYPDREINAELVQEVLRRSEEADEEAAAAISELEEYLAIGLANIINCFDPGRVCIGGYLGIVLQTRVQELTDRVNQLLLPYMRCPRRIFCSGLGEWGAVLGELSSARELLFEKTAVAESE